MLNMYYYCQLQIHSNDIRRVSKHLMTSLHCETPYLMQKPASQRRGVPDDHPLLTRTVLNSSTGFVLTLLESREREFQSMAKNTKLTSLE